MDSREDDVKKVRRKTQRDGDGHFATREGRSDNGDKGQNIKGADIRDGETTIREETKAD